MLPPRGVASPGGMLPPRGWCFLGVGVPGGDPPRTATAVGGTHPTGMHSCLYYKFSFDLHMNTVDLNALWNSKINASGYKTFELGQNKML